MNGDYWKAVLAVLILAGLAAWQAREEYKRGMWRRK